MQASHPRRTSCAFKFGALKLSAIKLSAIKLSALGLAILLANSQPAWSQVCTPNNSAGGCAAGKKHVLKSQVIGIKSTRQFVKDREVRRFRNASNAQANGYTAFIAPTPTATPTATATPAVSSFQGRYQTTDEAPLLRVSASDTCDDIGLTQQVAASLDISVLHGAGETVVRAEEAITLPTGINTPAPSGPRLWGAADSTRFEVTTSFGATTVAGISCSSPTINRTYDFAAITSTQAAATRTDRIICPGGTPTDCVQVWTGTAVKSTF